MKLLIRATYPPLLLTAICLVLAVIFPAFLVLALVFLVDFRGRVNDYRYLISLRDDNLQLNRKIMDRYGRTWCGRTVFLHVFPSSALYYYARGYRWFHVFPDGAFSRHSPFIKKIFWTNLMKGHRR